MGDLWQRYQNAKALIDIIKECLMDENYPWGACCLTIGKDGMWKCSRYKLPEKEFKKKCRKCKEEIRRKLGI